MHFVETGVVLPATVFAPRVVGDSLARAPVESDLVLYRRYRNGDKATLALLKRLTQGRFEFGAIAQEILREYWSRGTAPTFAEFATVWLQAVAAYKGPNPEWAYLNDRVQGTAGQDWKQFRVQRARVAIELFQKATEAVLP